MHLRERSPKPDLKGKRSPLIGIDPGHGGRDPGAVGRKLGLQEKVVTLDIARTVSDRLKEKGFPVVMSRNEDRYVPLGQRVQRFNSAGVKLVVSIHINSARLGEASYMSAFVVRRGGNAERAANILLPLLVKEMGWPNGGVREADFYILQRTTAPAVLLENGFISNGDQELALSQPGTRERLAGAIAEGIEAYWKAIR